MGKETVVFYIYTHIHAHTNTQTMDYYSAIKKNESYTMNELQEHYNK